MSEEPTRKLCSCYDVVFWYMLHLRNCAALGEGRERRLHFWFPPLFSSHTFTPPLVLRSWMAPRMSCVGMP